MWGVKVEGVKFKYCRGKKENNLKYRTEYYNKIFILSNSGLRKPV